MSNVDLSAAVEAVREGWPGHHFTRDGFLFEAPPVRDDGATARLIEYAVETAAPLIEAAVREQVAADIEAVANRHMPRAVLLSAARVAYTAAARIARGPA